MAGQQTAAFAWYELLTTDMAAALTFYGRIIGWEAQDASTPRFPYTMFTAAKVAIAGLMELPDDGRKRGAKPRWVGYVAVDDVDAAVSRLTRLGGKVYVPPTDSNIGRISIVADPQAATLALASGLKVGVPSANIDRPGGIGWHELLAADSTQAFAFYSELLGWQKAKEEVGSIDSYQLFAAGGRTIGGMFTKLQRAPVPFWLYYFNVADMDLAIEAVKAGGGKVVQGPFELGAGSWIARCVDPQGAMFALQGRRSRGGTEAPEAAELNWSAEWGGFASRGKVLAKS